MRAAPLAIVAAIALTACQATPASEEGPASEGTPASEAAVQLPSSDGAADYQLGGAYDPPDGVTIVVRDSTAPIADGLYSICYVNGFQTQPADAEWWVDEHPDAVLTDDAGEPVVDPGWPDEYVLDTSTEARRAEIADVLAESIQRCADAGYQAVELDNLDTWTRFDELTMEGNLALATLLIEQAHDLGMAVAQKNAPDLGELGPETGFDLVISEECAVWGECGAYGDVYGDLHIDIEYEDAFPEGSTSFQEVCALPDLPPLTVYRDEHLVPAGHPDHVFELCLTM